MSPLPDVPREIEIEKLVYGGDGLARPNGRVVLAPFTLPGERVAIESPQARGGVVRARTASILAPSAVRIEAACPHFRRCGGCHYQHAAYDAQVAAKRDILRETLRRVGKLEVGEIETLAADPWAYRNRVQLHFAHGRMGFREAGSHDIVDVGECPIASPKLQAAIAAFHEMMRDTRWPRFVREIELFTNETDVQITVTDSPKPVAHRFYDWCAEQIPGAREGRIDYAAAGFTFTVGPRSFFQVNRHLIEPLIDAALRDAGQNGRAIDLYAGVGLFSLPLARRFRQVTAVESGAGAARDLTRNAERAGVSIDVKQELGEVFLAHLETKPTFVLADPPRAGLGKLAVKRLVELKPWQLTIVSCDPATLGRDLAGLVEGGYKIERITMVDLFPQTYHLETVVHLRA